MTTELRVNDVIIYLTETGWQRELQGWNGATLWQYSGEYEVLVPARDGLGDGQRRIRDILRCLSTVEGRPPDDIAVDISHPFWDKQFFRTSSTGHEPGYTSLVSGVQVVHGARNLLASAARTALQGPHYAFTGRPPRVVADVLRAAELGPSRPGSFVVEVRLSTTESARMPGGDEVPVRAVSAQLREAVMAAQAAVTSGRQAAFDETVTAGVSADLCRALSDLAGAGHDEPFEITFRWARSQPVDVSPDPVVFPASAGPLLQAAAVRLRGLNASGGATVTGVVEGLYDDVAGGDRWRIKVRGELRSEQVERARRAVWVRLGDQATYDRAMALHRQRTVITVTGELTSATGRVELLPGRGLEL
jgi:hypothetical protein